MSDARDNVQQEFLAEAQELVEALSRDLLLLDEAHQSDDRIEPSLINEIFRSVHTLKGIAGMFGYKHVGAVAHALEDLLDDGATALARAAERITGEAPDPERVAAAIAKFAFSRQAGRSSGQEDRSSFLRKGRAGDWVNHFTPEAAEIFDRYAGETLVSAGYEPDRSWVERVGDGS